MGFVVFHQSVFDTELFHVVNCQGGRGTSVWEEESVLVSALTNSGIHLLSLTDSDFDIQKAKVVKNMRVHANGCRKL